METTQPLAEPEPLKTTAVGDLPVSWDVVSLGELFEVQQGKALSQAARHGPSLRSFLRTANVFWGRLELTKPDRMHFSEEEANRLSLRPGDLLVCEGGEIGRSALWKSAEKDYCFQNHIHRLRALSPTVDPKFVMYWLQAAFLHLGVYSGVGNRTTIPNLSASRLKQLEVPQPPFSEQRAIADVLSKLQTAVELQDRIVATLKALKAATMAKLFREGLRGEPLRQTEIGEIPESWAVVSLGEHCRITSGGTPSRHRPEYWTGTIPWVKTGEINYQPIKETEEHISESGLANSAARLLPPGTLLMAMYGQGVTRGRVAFLNIAATTNQACAALNPDDDLDTGFLYAYLSSAYARIRELGHGANQRNLSGEIIKRIRIPLPPTIDEQRKLYLVIRALDSALEVEGRRGQIRSQVFQLMLCGLMTGGLRGRHQEQ